MIIRDKALKYGHNVDTDVIIPARYLNTSDPDELAAHCFEDLDKDFGARLKSKKIVVAGQNFGCGSSREHAPLAIKGSGVKLVIAASFARIFFRNAINIGLPVIQSREAALQIEDGDELDVDLSQGIINNLTQNKTYNIKPLPEFIQRVIESGGYINFVKKQLGSQE
ncbi:MAG: 3-isopropylmalate dehydratase small subunit [Actinomycetota bacterium]|nr:3-isopropylmalate dehydratase small subunit [Actinomycetota bacterium]